MSEAGSSARRCGVSRRRWLVDMPPPGSGKTSLVLGLCGHGASVLTDEVGLISVDDDGPRGESMDLIPFPRDLIVHSNTQKLFPRPAYGDEPAFKRFPDRCHVSSDRLEPGTAPASTAVHPNRLLFPSFVPDGGMALTRLGPAETVRRLLLQT